MVHGDARFTTHDGGAFFSGGVPIFMGNFAWGCQSQISGGAKFTMALLEYLKQLGSKCVILLVAMRSFK